MPNINEELSQMLDPHKNTLRGVVGLTESVIKVTNRASFVWVRLLDNLSEAIQAYNRTVNPVYNLPVILKFDGTKYEIISVDANRYTQWNSVQAYLPEHGMQHSAMYGASGNDIVWVDQKQFLPLLATPTGGTGTNVVGIVPYTFRNSQGNWIFAGNTGVICPPSVMATGSTIQLLCLQDSDGMPYFKAGTPFVGSISGTPAFLPYLPTVLNNNNDIPIAAIIRTGNVTGTPLGWPDFIDVRQFYKGYVSAPTGSSSYMETFKVSVSGTLIGNVNEIDFYGNFSGTKLGNKAKIYDKSIYKVYTDTSLLGDGTLLNPLKLTVTGSNTGGGSIGVIEADGAPSGTPINTLVFPVNSLGITGTNAFVTFPGGGSGTGDVVGPGSATNGNLAVFDGTSGKRIKDGGAAPVFADSSGYIQFYVSTSEPTASIGTWAASYWNDIGTVCYGGNGFQNTSSAQNDQLSWDFWLPAGTYTATFSIRKSSNTCIITLNQDGSSMGTVDTYAASPAFAKVSITGWTVSSAGKHTIQIKAASKNASSSSYQLGIFEIVIRRTA